MVVSKNVLIVAIAFGDIKSEASDVEAIAV
jgi:hypothetical protein